ncbi:MULTISPECIES: chemotaxis protein CheX [unclassified Psychrobacter]|uniref:chemotaxis protein CheX n=1 Tax=unclassified Psychrobacter TaxID=196806 RepID=UPI00078D0504|nr:MULTISPECIES: chemotaxis protein CheX [unclassified Psychrobacter]AMN48866.1 chemotaxis protein CheC [Psychrobacter sp. P2G3]AMN66688.1 chemotaxis protein CheC [Psychrobacter sp. P11G5]
MVKVEKLGVFLSSINAFFTQIDDAQVAISTPYLNNNRSAIGYDYSGVIEISGPLKGCVYVSAPSIMLREVIKVMGEPDSSITMMKDLLGEMANTISGNARTEFGSEFIISPPKIVEGAPSVSYLPKDRHSYITPFTWRGYEAVIGICIA